MDYYGTYLSDYYCLLAQPAAGNHILSAQFLGHASPNHSVVVETTAP